MITNIYKVSQLNEDVNIYKIRIDCSENYSNNVVVIKSDQIRDLKEFIQYQEEDLNISKATHTYGVTVGHAIADAVIVNAEIDSNNNVIKGTIIEGTLTDAITMDGVIKGTNSTGHNITLIHGQTSGGTISEGEVVSGALRNGEITGGTTNEETGVTTNVTLKGTLVNFIINKTTITNAYTINIEMATIIEHEITDGKLYDAKITGSNMYTKGGVTVGNVTTGGITVGGNATGGIATGTINGEIFNIIGGTTTYTNQSSFTQEEINNIINYSSITNVKEGRLVTQGGTVIGGTVIGGTKVGNAIYGAIIQGGVAINGITTGGTTSGGQLIPGPIKEIIESPIDAGTTYDRDGDPHIHDIRDGKIDPETYGYRYKTNHLLLMTDKATQTQFYTNFGTALIEGVPRYVHP